MALLEVLMDEDAEPIGVWRERVRQEAEADSLRAITEMLDQWDWDGDPPAALYLAEWQRIIEEIADLRIGTRGDDAVADFLAMNPYGGPAAGSPFVVMLDWQTEGRGAARRSFVPAHPGPPPAVRGAG